MTLTVHGGGARRHLRTEAACSKVAGSDSANPAPYRTGTLALAVVLLLAAPLAAQNQAELGAAQQLRGAAAAAGEAHIDFLVLSLKFDDDVRERRSPFNAAAAAKYCAEYIFRALLAPKMRREFDTVAGNLAYDAVAEAADAAELGAEMAAIAPDLETAERAAVMALDYYLLAEIFNAQIRPVDRKQAGQRLLRASHAADRARRYVERMKERQ